MPFCRDFCTNSSFCEQYSPSRCLSGLGSISSIKEANLSWQHRGPTSPVPCLMATLLFNQLCQEPVERVRLAESHSWCAGLMGSLWWWLTMGSGPTNSTGEDTGVGRWGGELEQDWHRLACAAVQWCSWAPFYLNTAKVRPFRERLYNVYKNTDLKPTYMFLSQYCFHSWALDFKGVGSLNQDGHNGYYHQFFLQKMVLFWQTNVSRMEQLLNPHVLQCEK